MGWDDHDFILFHKKSFAESFVEVFKTRVARPLEEHSSTTTLIAVFPNFEVVYTPALHIIKAHLPFIFHVFMLCVLER